MDNSVRMERYISAEDFYTLMESPLGKIALTSNGEAITGLYLPESPGYDSVQQGTKSTHYFSDAIQQLREYFAGKRTMFDLPLAPIGTAFQQKVWKQLQRIPYGKTVSYKAIAHRLDKPSASRAVGNANGKNPICLIIPCHRVIAADGSLGGYTSGLANKQWLLDHENRQKSA